MKDCSLHVVIAEVESVRSNVVEWDSDDQYNILETPLGQGNPFAACTYEVVSAISQIFKKSDVR